MKENGIHYQRKKVNKNKSNLRKYANRNILYKRPLKNIDNNESYPSDDENINDSSTKRVRTPLARPTINNFEKENTINKNNISAFPAFRINGGIQNLPNYNNVISLNQGLPNQKFIFVKRNLSPITRLNVNYKTINNKPINSNILNFHTINNFYSNPSLNQNYNFNTFNANQMQNKYILVLNPNLNQQILTQPYSIIRTRLNLNGLHYQNQIIPNNEMQPRITNINLQNKYVLDNNLNLENKGIVNGYKLFDKDNNINNYQNNYLTQNYGNINHQNINKDLNVPLTYNKILSPGQIPINNINTGQRNLNNIGTDLNNNPNSGNINNNLNANNNTNKINNNLNIINNNRNTNTDIIKNNLNIINNMNINTENDNKNLNLINNKETNNISNINENKPLSNQIRNNIGPNNSGGINNELINNIQNNINPNMISNRLNVLPNNNNFGNNMNINPNGLNIFPNNNAQKNLLNNIQNGNINNKANNTSLNQSIDPLVDELVNQDTNQEINNILNNNNPSFQTISNINQNNLINMNIDNYINNQQKAQKKDDLNFQQQIKQKYQEPQMQNKNSLINQQKEQPMNPYLNFSPQKNQRDLRLTLANDNYLTKPQNDFVNHIQDTNQLQNNYNQQRNSILNQPISQSQLFSQNNNQNGGMNNITKDGIILKNFAFLSRPGNNEMGLSKTNQDSFVVKTNINNIKDFNIFGVLDGHGPMGHFVSKFASLFITNYIINNHEIKDLTNQESIYLALKKNNFQIIKQAFILTDNQLKSQKFDSKESGSTCVLVIQIGNHIICANVGDSRAIAVFDEQNDLNLNNLKFTPLSIDYKPELPEEKNRILMSGGLIEQYKNSFGEGIGPYRVFAPGEDYPGLAMSRSIGDLDGKNLGIISEPGIIEYNINGNTKYVVLCSDGVWEFLTNEHVKDVGKEFYLSNNPNGFCQELITQSVIEWQGNDSLIDDITAIALYF